MKRADTDLRELSNEQLIARLQIAHSENDRLRENNAHLHKMMETLRDNGWATPRPAVMPPGYQPSVNIRSYPLHQGGPIGSGVAAEKRATELAHKLSEASQRADHWRQKYMDLLDSTGRDLPRG